MINLQKLIKKGINLVLLKINGFKTAEDLSNCGFTKVYTKKLSKATMKH